MAARKVYWKGLRLVLGIVKRYIERNQLGLTDHLTGPQMECVIAVLTAVITCLDTLPDNTPE
jgi:hypothetical protein